MAIVFFDLDGVLADFVRGALALHGRLDIPIREVTWGIEAQLNLEPAKFWEPLGFDFWANLAVYPDGLSLLRATEVLVGPERIAFVTSPCQTAGCVDGKRAWVERHFPDYSRRLFMGSAKELFASGEKILVDDHDKNIKAFAAAGGRFVQPPRPWNSLAPAAMPDGSFNVPQVFKILESVVRQVS